MPYENIKRDSRLIIGVSSEFAEDFRKYFPYGQRNDILEPVLSDILAISKEFGPIGLMLIRYKTVSLLAEARALMEENPDLHNILEGELPK